MIDRQQRYLGSYRKIPGDQVENKVDIILTNYVRQDGVNFISLNKKIKIWFNKWRTQRISSL